MNPWNVDSPVLVVAPGMLGHELSALYFFQGTLLSPRDLLPPAAHTVHVSLELSVVRLCYLVKLST